MSLTFGSLFAGIGGMDLGLERAGMRCVWQVEIEPYCRAVLAKHWPDVRRHDDVKTFPPTQAEEWGCDLICGGFPCQDISNAGKRAGIDGERSGLWSEFARIIRVVRPRYVVVENVAALLGRGMGRVLGDLAALGFDAEWDVLPAGAFGLPHIRERLFVVADAMRERRTRILGDLETKRLTPFWKIGGIVRKQSALESYRRIIEQLGYDLRRPGISGEVDGVPCRVERLTGLGNAVVPQVAEFIGRRIIEFMKGTSCHDTTPTGTR